MQYGRLGKSIENEKMVLAVEETVPDAWIRNIVTDDFIMSQCY